MEHQELHGHGCTHCACRNPVLEALKEELFSPDNFTAFSAIKSSPQRAKPCALMVSGEQ